jgi:putative ABC transport system permease protein
MVTALAHLLPPEITIGQPIAIDRRAVVYLGVLTIGGSLFLAWGPLLLLRRQNLMAGLRGRIPIVGGLSYSRMRSAMLVAQVTLVSGLLYVAVATVHALAVAKATDVGVDVDHVVGVALPGDARHFGTTDLELIRQDVGRLPFVSAVAGGEVPILGGKAVVSVLAHAPRSLDEMRDRNAVERRVSRGFFRVMGNRVLAGSDEEMGTRSDVAVLSSRLSQMLGLGDSAVGRSIYVNGGRVSIVGVVSDVWGDGPSALSPTPYIYRPEGDYVSSVVVRTTPPAATRTATITRVVQEAIGVRGPLRTTLAVEQYVHTTAQVRSQATLFGLLSLSSFFLGTFGVFCLTSENVRRGARDAAVRAALGACSRDLVGGVVLATVRRVALGVIAGLAFGVASAQLAASVVTGLHAFDVIAAGVVALLMMLTAAIAAVIPAKRVRDADLLILLREE